MELLQIIILAIVQGITEFLPISSSAHLILTSQLLAWPDQGKAFDVAVHVGSLVAVVGYFRQDIRKIIVQGWILLCQRRQSVEGWLAVWLIVATIPTIAIGGILLVADIVENYLRNPLVIAWTTIIFALVLWWVDKIALRKKSLNKMNGKSAVYIGIAQALAFVPGVSRSGITITAALYAGFDRQAAARFAFLLAIPLIILGGVQQSWALLQDNETFVWWDIGVAVILSAIMAYSTIHLLLRWIDKIGFMPFIIYRLLLGVFLLWLFS